MFTPQNFICKQCGKCCLTFTVKLSDKDMERIKQLCYKKEFFAEPDNYDAKTGKYSLKRVNKQCIFLRKRDNKYFCKIYEARPEICRKYPFIEADEVENCEPTLGLNIGKKQ